MYLQSIHAYYIPHRILAGTEVAQEDRASQITSPLLQGRRQIPAVFVCQRQICSAPLTTTADVHQALAHIARDYAA